MAARSGRKHIGAALDLLTIVIFAIAAAALILRLRSVLGRRTGHEQRPPQNDRHPIAGHRDENIIEMPSRNVDRPIDQIGDDAERGDRSPQEFDVAGAGAGLRDELTKIGAADQSFGLETFQSGAQAAFAMIIESYADGDKETLHGLLSGDVYANFAAAIQDRQDKKLSLETSLIGLLKNEIVEAKLDNLTANITVKLVSEQINVTRDSEGRVVDGDPNQVSTVTDYWTFSRDTKSRNPNWVLIATDSSN